MPATATVRQTPAGRKLPDGFASFTTFADDPDISFWERGVKPPGVDGGDAIDLTTMHNVTYRTMASRGLITLTQGSMTALYDPAVYSQCVAQINREQAITIRYSDGSTLAFFGFMKSFEPNEMTEGNPPEATVTFVPTNVDPATGAESAPVLTSVAGT